MNIKTIIVVVAIIGGGAYYYTSQNGNTEQELTKVYRWVENGEWSYSNTAPMHINQELIEAVYIDPNTNVVQAYEPPEPANSKSTKDNSSDSQRLGEKIGSELKSHIDKAKGVQDIMDKEAKDLEEAMKNVQ